MAKSIRLIEIDTQRASFGPPAARGLFWEHWFENEPENEKRRANQTLDEHGIWEKAINLEILAIDGKK